MTVVYMTLSFLYWLQVFFSFLGMDNNFCPFCLQLKAFQTDSRENLLDAKRAVEQAIESTSNNIAWMNSHYPVISQWLREKQYFLI